MKETLTTDAIDKVLLDRYQRDFPLSDRPFADIAQDLNLSEQDVLQRLRRLTQAGAVSRIGAVTNHRKVGASTLAAMQVPDEQLLTVAEAVNQFEGVNHNYQREHRFNLWFVLTASSQRQLEQILKTIEQSFSYPLLVLPMERAFHIDLGFPLWN